jgi:hypothetical protein
LRNARENPSSKLENITDVDVVDDPEVIFISLVCVAFVLGSWLIKVIFLELKRQVGSK